MLIFPETQRFLYSVLWALFASGIAWYILHVGSQITYVTLADGTRQIRKMPLLIRLHLPLVPNLSPVLSANLFAGSRARIDRRLVSAGFEGVLTGEHILGLRILMPLLSGTLWFLLVRTSAAAAPESIIDRSQVTFTCIGVLWLYIYPDLWLKRMLVQRHRQIQRALPFVLDLLTLSVEAGMDFMTAMQRNIKRRNIDALGEELIRVIREIQLGKTRAQALKDLAYRVNLSDLRAVVNALVQADELGVSIGSILRIQADQMRQRRFERAEKLANEAPVKMLFPLMVFIFPAVFLILLGPIIYRLLQEGL